MTASRNAYVAVLSFALLCFVMAADSTTDGNKCPVSTKVVMDYQDGCGEQISLGSTLPRKHN
jgi:hypothetical protein